MFSRSRSSWGGEGGRAVEADFPMPTTMLACDRDVDQTGLGWVGEDLVEVRGGIVTQHSGRPAGEDRGHLVGVRRNHGTDEIDTSQQWQIGRAHV